MTVTTNELGEKYSEVRGNAVSDDRKTFINSFRATTPGQKDSIKADNVSDQAGLGAVRSAPNAEEEAQTPEERANIKGGVVGDIGTGLAEAPRQVAGGLRDAAQAVLDLSKIADETFSNLPSVIQFKDPKTGEFDLDLLTPKEAEQIGLDYRITLPEVKQPESNTGEVVRTLAQFLIPFSKVSKIKGLTGAATKLGKVGQASAAGAITDFTFFDAQEANLSDLIQKIPSLANPVTEYLQSDPNDSELEGRFKRTIEGLGLGATVDGFFSAVKALRSARIAKKASKALRSARIAKKAAKGQKAASNIDQVKLEAGEKLAAENIETAAEGANSLRQALGGDDAPVVSIRKSTPKPITDDQLQAFNDAAVEGVDKAVNINMSRIDSADDVKAILEKTGKAFAGEIDQARRGKISHDATQSMANDLGMTVDELLSRRQGQAFNAEEALAARRIMISSGESLLKLSKKAASADASSVDLLAFRRGLAVHNAIQQQVSGATAEAGRALSQFRIPAGAQQQQVAAINDMISASGGSETSRKLAEIMSTIDDPAVFNKIAREIDKPELKDMALEVWINGLLSNPVTHSVNALSNAAVAFYAVPERFVASKIGRLVGDQAIDEGEAAAQMFGLVHGARDGFRLAWQALKTGEPSDVLNKLEVAKHKAITGENLNLSGTAGRFADYVGEAVRMPGRFLGAGDEFFRSVGYRMELTARSYRMAMSEGLEGEALGARMHQLIQNTPPHIKAASIDASRLQTFTNPLGEPGQALQKVTNTFWPAKVIIPFVRTPVNIMKYVGVRSPLAPLAKSVRADIAAGGARRDLALSKMSLGSMFMLSSMDYVWSGDVVGGGPTNPALRRIWRQTGKQPYSIKIGDQWVAYNRFDPLGAMIGMAADVAEIAPYADDPTIEGMAAATMLSISKNVTSKTWLQGASRFFEAMSSAKADPEAKNTAIKRWIQSMAGSTVPAVVAQIGRQMDPTLRETQDILEKIKSRTPGLSDQLPPRRNIWGDPIMLQGALGWDIVSPFYVSTPIDDPVSEELVSQQLPIQMPRRQIKGIDLTPEEYDNYTQLSAGVGLPGGVPTLKKALSDIIRSPEYKQASDGPDGHKSTIIRKVVTQYRQAAQAIMLRDNPVLNNAVIIKATENQ